MDIVETINASNLRSMANLFPNVCVGKVSKVLPFLKLAKVKNIFYFTIILNLFENL